MTALLPGLSGGRHPGVSSAVADTELREGTAAFRGVLIGVGTTLPFWVAVITAWTLQ